MHLLNCYITKWETSNYFDVAERRPRKLLAHKKEIQNLRQRVSEEGYTLMPLRLYFSNSGKCKVLVGLCKGKHNYDKRAVDKAKQAKRDIDRALKGV